MGTQKELERLLGELPGCQVLDRHFLNCHLHENKIQLWGALIVQKNLTVANEKRCQILTVSSEKHKSRAKAFREIVEKVEKSTLKCSSWYFVVYRQKIYFLVCVPEFLLVTHSLRLGEGFHLMSDEKDNEKNTESDLKFAIELQRCKITITDKRWQEIVFMLLIKCDKP